MKQPLLCTLLLFCALFFMGCKSDPAPLSQKVVEDIMYDLYVAKQVVEVNQVKLEGKYDPELIRQRQETFVFNKYQTTRQLYDSSLFCYGKDLPVYLEICDHVIERFKQKQKELVNLAEKQVVQQDKYKDLNLDKEGANILLNNSFYSTSCFADSTVLNLTVLTGGHLHLQDTLLLSFDLLTFHPTCFLPRMMLSLSFEYEGDSIVEYSTVLDSIPSSFQYQYLLDPNLVIERIQGTIMTDRLMQESLFIDRLKMRRFLYRKNY